MEETISYSWYQCVRLTLFSINLGIIFKLWNFCQFDRLKKKSILLLLLQSVQFSCSVVSDSLQSRGLQHARPPCPSPTPEFTQTHVHWVGDAIQPSHPPLSPSHAFDLFQHQGIFKWVSSSHQVAKVLKFQLQHQSFQWIFRTDFLYDGLVWSPCLPQPLLHCMVTVC